MLKTALKVLLVLFLFRLNAQVVQEEGIVYVTGNIYSSKDSSGVAASILYEKLPYYDDMGIVVSNSDGSFSIPLVKGNAYSFSVTKDGFLDYSQEINIEGNGSPLTQQETFYIKVDEVELIKLENLIFDRASAKISQSSYSELNELAKWMNENNTVVIQLEGHTDFRGNASANMALSQARVDAVKEYLVDRSVRKNRVLTKAFGGTQPLSREDTNEAKTLNRRVEVRVVRR